MTCASPSCAKSAKPVYQTSGGRSRSAVLRFAPHAKRSLTRKCFRSALQGAAHHMAQHVTCRVEAPVLRSALLKSQVALLRRVVAPQLKRATTYPADYVDTFVTRFPDVQVRAGCLLLAVHGRHGWGAPTLIPECKLMGAACSVCQAFPQLHTTRQRCRALEHCVSNFPACLAVLVHKNSPHACLVRWSGRHVHRAGRRPCMGGGGVAVGPGAHQVRHTAGLAVLPARGAHAGAQGMHITLSNHVRGATWATRSLL